MQIEVMNLFKGKINKHFSIPAKIFNILKIKPWFLTGFSFIFGLMAAYFLFQDLFYFFVFGVLHIIFDVLDGSLARYNGTESILGAHLDNGSDRLVVLAILVKSLIYFNEVWILLVLAIFVIHHLIHIFSNFRYPVAYSRSVMFILFFLQFYYWGLVFVLLFSIYGLLKQARHRIKT